ncbi:hypothetical protein Clacol_005282 [Clathrus columnatus]|uniref:Cerato-platanin n=1 Tax=Clathrus columnatus TaxID=1419009 RepID=A0AAV5ADH7_9AGAM|nr:hypothetical protein Clacol_005282 [Clathrus columnatus]
MKCILTSVAVLSALFAHSQAQNPVSVSFDTIYDNPAGSTSTTACSNGPHGGLELRFPTFGSFPNFPNIGGASVISGFGSANCGTCWELEFQGNSINVMAIDVALNGFNIAEAAFDTLTNGQAENVGRINATATQVPAFNCGL